MKTNFMPHLLLPTYWIKYIAHVHHFEEICQFRKQSSLHNSTHCSGTKHCDSGTDTSFLKVREKRMQHVCIFQSYDVVDTKQGSGGGEGVRGTLFKR